MNIVNLKITILVHGVVDPGPNFEEVMARTVAKDVLAWIHSDDSGLSGDTDTQVTAELIGSSGKNPGRCYRKNYSGSGEAIEEVALTGVAVGA
jgi:hypothetical protein